MNYYIVNSLGSCTLPTSWVTRRHSPVAVVKNCFSVKVVIIWWLLYIDGCSIVFTATVVLINGKSQSSRKKHANNKVFNCELNCFPVSNVLFKCAVAVVIIYCYFLVYPYCCLSRRSLYSSQIGFTKIY